MLAVALAAGLPACSDATDAQPYAGSCAPFAPVAWEPAADAKGVPRNPTLRVTFADYPDPDTVNVGSMILTTGVFWHPGTFAVDLLRKAVLFRATSVLNADLGYTLSIMPSLLSLRGCAAPKVHEYFETGAEVTPPSATPTTPFSAVQPILAAHCGGAGCHRGLAAEGGACLAAPAAALSLCDADALAALVAVPSRQVAKLSLVEPHNSARSYLLRKLLPEASWPDMSVPTVRGHRGAPGAPLDDAALATVAAWIDSGAVR
jgi:hypothetical protein